MYPTKFYMPHGINQKVPMLTDRLLIQLNINHLNFHQSSATKKTRLYFLKLFIPVVKLVCNLFSKFAKSLRAEHQSAMSVLLPGF